MSVLTLRVTSVKEVLADVKFIGVGSINQSHLCSSKTNKLVALYKLFLKNKPIIIDNLIKNLFKT